MIGRVIITSVKEGLGDGPGFQPVVRTKLLEKNVVDYVLRETGYNHPYPPGDKLNPTIFSHRIATIQGKIKHFLIRVEDAISDYSGRSNRLSQCLVIDHSDVSSLQTGPCEILLGFPWETSWRHDRTPVLETSCPAWKTIAQPSPPCLAWEKATGDAGWAGQLSLSVGKKQKVLVVADPEDNVLSLFQEALALLPLQSRWSVTFSSCQLDASDVMWKGQRRDIRHDSSTDLDFIIDLKDVRDHQQKAPDSHLAACARGKKPISQQKPPLYIDGKKTLRISKSLSAKNTNSRDHKNKRASPQRQNAQTEQTIDHAAAHKGAPRPEPLSNLLQRPADDPSISTRFLLGLGLFAIVVFVISILIFSDTDDWLNEPKFSKLNKTPTSINTRQNPARTKTIVSKHTPNNDSAKELPDKTTSGKPASEDQEQMAADTTKVDTRNNPQDNTSTTAENEKTTTTPEQPDSSWEDAIKTVQGADGMCSLPNIGLDKPQSIGIPWPDELWKYQQDQQGQPIGIEISNDELMKFDVEFQKKTQTWTVSVKRNGVSGPTRVPIAEIGQKNEMLFWKWTPESNRSDATQMLFSRLTFPTLLNPDKPFTFLHAVEAKNNTLSLQDCIPNEKLKKKGLRLKINDSFFHATGPRNKALFNLGWEDLISINRLWDQLELRLRLTSQSFKLPHDANPLELKNVNGKGGFEPVECSWSNEELLRHKCYGQQLRPCLSIKYERSEGQPQACLITLQIKSNGIKENQFMGVNTRDILRDPDILNSIKTPELSALLRDKTLPASVDFYGTIPADLINWDAVDNAIQYEADFQDAKTKTDFGTATSGSNRPSIGFPYSRDELSQNFPESDLRAARQEVKQAILALIKPFNEYKKKQNEQIEKTITDLKELRGESFDVRITCGLNASDVVKSNNFETPIVGEK